MMTQGFGQSRGGSVATMTGIVFLLLTSAVGGAIDFGNATTQRSDMQTAADQAVLAAASNQNASNDSERLALAKQFFLASPFCEKNTCDAESIVTSMDGPAIALDATASVDTAMLQIIGWDAIDVGASAKAIPPSGTPVDVVMMLDYSGSMNSSNKYQDMAAAAKQFLDNIDSRRGDYMQVGVVPFSKYVLTPMPGQFLYDVAAGTDLTGTFVVGCVLNREYPHSISVATPTSANEGSLWPVYSYVTGTNPNTSGYSDDFTPPAPEEMTFDYNSNTYTVRYIDHQPGSGYSSPTFHELSHTSTGGDDDDDGGSYYPPDPHLHGYGELSMTFVGANPTSVDQLDFLPWDPSALTYGGYAESEDWSAGSDSGLPPEFSSHQLSEDLGDSCSEYADNTLWARPLSTNFNALKTAISSMTPIGLTNIALALDLGWHMLTSPAPFTEGSSDADAEKVAILLTDGVQTVKANGPGGSVSVSSANAVIAESCEAMKAEGVEVFTIAFGISDSYTRDLLKQCATDEPHYFEPSEGGQLDTVFDKIFKLIAKDQVRLSG